MSNHKLLQISSRDRDNKSDLTSNFKVNINNIAQLQRVKGVILKQATIPITFYNITAENNTFTYAIAAVNASFTIAVGQYTTLTLITAMVSAGSALGIGITQLTTTNNLSFTSTTAIQFLNIQNNAMAEVLGIIVNSVGDVTSYVCGGLPDLGGLKNIYISSVSIGESNIIRSNGKSQNIFAIIPVNTVYGGTEHYIADSLLDDIDINSSTNISSLDIKLLDHNGAVINLYGHHINIMMKIYY